EAAMMNLLEPGERAVVAVNGAFGGRMADMAGRAGADVVIVEHEWGEPVDPGRGESAPAGGPPQPVAFRPGPTSPGARRGGARALSPGPRGGRAFGGGLRALARRHRRRRRGLGRRRDLLRDPEMPLGSAGALADRPVQTGAGRDRRPA